MNLQRQLGWISTKNQREVFKIQTLRNVHEDEKTFRKMIMTAARNNILAGRYPEVRPQFSTNAAKLAKGIQCGRLTLILELSRKVKKNERNKWKEIAK